MTKKQKSALSLAVAGCVLGISGTVHADTLIGNWENVDDGWIEWSTQDPIIDSGVGTYSTTGVTLGSSSLKIVPTGNWDQNLAIKLQDSSSHPDYRPNFLASTQFSIDVTWNTADWTGSGEWAILELTINAEGIGWTSQGRPDYDTGNPNYPGGWDPFNFGQIHTRTVTWDYSHLLDGNTENGEITTTPGHPYWVEFIITTTYHSTFTSGAYYFDNARLVTVLNNGVWTGNVDNLWSGTGNWTGGVPNGIDHTATFGSITTGQYAVNVDGTKTVGTITFDSAVGYTLSGGTIVMQASSGAPSIIAGIGSHTIASTLTLNNWLFVTVGNGATLNFTGPINVTATGRQLSKLGGGLLQIEQINTGTIQVGAGTLRISAKGSPNSPSGTTVANNLVIASGAQLDLTNNSMIIDYTDSSPLATVQALLASGYNSGAWNGSGIITSSGTSALGLGYAEASDLGVSSFGGQPVDSTAVLIKFTYMGDSDLDGDVDNADFGTFFSHFQQTGQTWFTGDFDYDGDVDNSDFGLFFATFNSPPLPSEPLVLGAAVPEPGALGLVGFGLMGLLSRRRRE